MIVKPAIVTGATLFFAALPASANLLSDLYQRAVQHDGQYQAALAQHQAALQARPQLRAGILPTLGASASYSRNRQDVQQTNFPGGGSGGDSDSSEVTFFNSLTANLQLTQPLFDWGVFARLRQIDERIAQAEAELSAADQALILRTVSAYFDWLAAEDSLRFARAEKEAIQQQLKQAQSRYEVGLSAITDVQEAQARFDLADAQEISAASTLRSSREALRVITGDWPDAPALLRTPLETHPPEPANPDAWVEQALNSNLDLKAAELARGVAREQIREQRASQLPSLNLIGTHRYSDEADRLFGSKSEFSSIGLQLDLPLFSGGANLARVKEQRFLHDRAIALLDQARREARQGARDAYDGVVTGAAQVRALRQAVKSSEVARDAVVAGFDVGSRTSVDVLDAQRELFRAQRDLSRARYDYLLSILRLKQSVGALSVADVDRLDGMLEGA